MIAKVAKHLFDCPLYDETGLCGFTPVLVVALGVTGLGRGDRISRCHSVFQLWPYYLS